MNVELSELTIRVYFEALVNYPEEDLRIAYQKTVQEWAESSRMPPVAFIINNLPQKNSELLAEQAWQWVQRYIRNYWHVDIGPFQGAPAMPAATEYAVRQVGGLQRIAYPLERDLDFIRRGFLESHQRFSVEGGAQTRLSTSEAKAILTSLRLAAGSELDRKIDE